MRISDWSSDVCSSDLSARSRRRRWQCAGALEAAGQARVRRGSGRCGQWLLGPISMSSTAGLAPAKADGESAGTGKSVIVCVDLGGRSTNKNKSTINNKQVLCILLNE